MGKCISERDDEAADPIYVAELRQVAVVSPIILIESDDWPDATPASSVCSAASSLVDVPRSLSMPVLLPEPPLNFSSAEWGLSNDNLSVCLADLDLTVFDVDHPCPLMRLGLVRHEPRAFIFWHTFSPRGSQCQPTR